MTTLSFFGNCQIRGLSDCFRAMSPEATILEGFSPQLRSGEVSPEKVFSKTDILFIQPNTLKQLAPVLAAAKRQPTVVEVPAIYFTAFHPDFVYASSNQGRVRSAIGGINSAIVLFGWKNGFSVDETVALFRPEVFDALGYFDHWRPSVDTLLRDAAKAGLDIEEEFESWRKSGCFLYCPNHPKLTVLAGLARALHRKLALPVSMQFPENIIPDRLASNVFWPVYPEIARHYSLRGEYIFKGTSGKSEAGRPFASFDLPSFVAQSFQLFDGIDRDTIECARLEDPRMQALFNFRGLEAAARSDSLTVNPYQGIRDHQLWKRAVATPQPDRLDPVVETKFKIGKDHRVATAGSCFAQHVAKALSRSGYNYFVPEDGEGLARDERETRNYGVFSARYGNLYTTRQLLQLFERSEGTREPIDTAWKRKDGRFVDPFRPQIEPAGFGDPAEVTSAARHHLQFVSRMWRELDVFVFTLGLTEAWRSKQDGSVYPLAPGVSGGSFDPQKHEFHNFSVRETVDDLQEFIQKLRAVNPRARIVLTVSPVPLIATYEPRHALVSTTYSKSVLRVAADEIARTHDMVDYFPSYEIITGGYSRGAYFDADLRTVKDEGVSHVMRVFLKHYSVQDEQSGGTLDDELKHGQGIICDEEEIERSVA